MTDDTMGQDVVARLNAVKVAMAEANKLSVNSDVEPTLIAVSKTYDANHIEPALKAGHRHFGENRIQEAQGKWPALKEKYPDSRLHLIGPIQSNKTADAVALFDFIHTVDREKIARTLAAEIAKSGKHPELLVQVNTGVEPQKGGVSPENCAEFVEYCNEDLELGIRGLMCIPPVDEEAGLHFSLLAKLAKQLGLSELSMGMSGDYEEAVKYGATYVRVGSAIFGSRG